MQAALRCRKYEEGVRIFERLRQADAPMTLPIYPTAMKLFGKLKKENEVRALWQEVASFDAVNHLVGQAHIDACADNGNITGAGEVLEYLENNSIEINANHFTSAINACANSKEKYKAKAARFLLQAMLERKLQPDIVTYSCALRSLQGAPGTEVLDLLDSMKDRGVMANNVFAESFFFIYLQQPRKGCWTSADAVLADVRSLPRRDLKKAKAVMDEFLAAGIELNRSCLWIRAALEALL